MSNRTLEECRWAMAIENSTLGVWDLDLRLDAVHYSPQWKARLGFSGVDAPDRSAFWRCRVHPDDFAPMLGSLRSHLDGCTPSYEMQFRLRSNGSGYRTVRSRGLVVARDESGHATRIVGTMVDVNGRPAYVANYGLAADAHDATQTWNRLPFHALLRSTPPFGGQVSDLLDITLRDAEAAR